MEEILKSPTWTDGSENLELINELLDNESPLLLVEQPPRASISSDRSNDGSPAPSMTEENTTIKRLISTVYSGPTIVDIENALSVNSTINPKTHLHNQLAPARISSVLGRGLSKAENKCTLKIKSTENGKVNDGYKWRKYGQKIIKNSPYHRSYYKCTNLRCGAKKQVERSPEDPNTLIITYEGLHHHFIYPYFLIDQPQHGNNNGGPPLKKRARKTVSSKTVQEDEKITHEEADGGETNKGARRETDMSHMTSDKCRESDSPTPSKQEQRGEILMERKLGQTRGGSVGPWGLLDDLVTSADDVNFDTSYNSSSSCLTYPSTPPSPSLPSRSWSPTYFNLLPDLGIN